MKNQNCEDCKHYVRKAKEPYKSIGDAFRACELFECHFEIKQIELDTEQIVLVSNVGA